MSESLADVVHEAVERAKADEESIVGPSKCPVCRTPVQSIDHRPDDWLFPWTLRPCAHEFNETRW